MLAADGRFTETGSQKGQHTMTEQNQTPDTNIGEDTKGHSHRGTEDDTKGHSHRGTEDDTKEDDTKGHSHR